MKRIILLAAFLFAASFVFAQSKTEEKPLRKIASGNGAKQVEEDVREAMKEVEVELYNMRIEIDEEVREAMREVRTEIRDMDFDMDDMDIDIDIDADHDFDTDMDFDFDNDFDIDIDIDIDAIVESALRAVDEVEIERIVEKAVRESTREVKVRVKP
jgi:hypothetical protein